MGGGMMMYVYIKSEPLLFTVGFYRPDGTWEPESDHIKREDAARRVAWLNGINNRTKIPDDIMEGTGP